LHLFYPSFGHLMSSLWPLGGSSPLSQLPDSLKPSDLWNSQMWTMTWAWKALGIPIGSQG
jgi:hypothetical protein